MSYKCTITLEIDTKREKDTLLRALRGMLLGLGFAARGKVRLTTEAKIDPLGFLPIFAFGVETDEPALTPIEQAAYASEAAERVADDDVDNCTADYLDMRHEQAQEANDAALAAAGALHDQAITAADAHEDDDEAAPDSDAFTAQDDADTDPHTPFDHLLGREHNDGDEA